VSNGNGNGPVTLDMSKAQPIAQGQPVTLDMSKARPIQSAGMGAAALGQPEDISTGPEGTTDINRLMSPASQADATRKGLGVAGGIASAATGGVGGQRTSSTARFWVERSELAERFSAVLPARLQRRNSGEAS
jgi:hypothetical protein